MPDDEYLDLVNEQDEVIGRKLRSEVYQEQLSNFRVVNAFVINRQGQIWIPRRAADKRMFPLHLDMSMGGHVSSGETYLEACRRELLEELNIDVATTPYRSLGKLTPHEHGTSAFMEVFEIVADETPDYNPADFIEAFWLTPQEVFDRLKAGDVSKDDLPRLVERFYHS